jgi:hypothetical protein
VKSLRLFSSKVATWQASNLRESSTSRLELLGALRKTFLTFLSSRAVSVSLQSQPVIGGGDSLVLLWWIYIGCCPLTQFQQSTLRHTHARASTHNKHPFRLKKELPEKDQKEKWQAKADTDRRYTSDNSECVWLRIVDTYTWAGGPEHARD